MIPVILPREGKETKKEPENVGVFMKRGEKIKWSLMMFEVDFIMNGNNGVNTCSANLRILEGTRNNHSLCEAGGFPKPKHRVHVPKQQIVALDTTVRTRLNFFSQWVTQC